MQYVSTRGQSSPISDREVLLQDRASDGGLYVPAFFPKLSFEFFKSLMPLSFADRTAQILHIFLPSFDRQELKRVCEFAFSRQAFQDGIVGKLREGNVYTKKPYFFECYYGMTGSVKDISQQFSSAILSLIMKKRDTKILLLSSSTGNNAAATFAAFKNKEKFLPLTLLPQHLMNDVQKYNLRWHKSKEAMGILVDGSFEQCQNYLLNLSKNIDFQNQLLSHNQLVVSTQAYTWISILPLLALVISLYVDLLNKEEEKMRNVQPKQEEATSKEVDNYFAMPKMNVEEELAKLGFNLAITDGHLGELMAAYYAMLMGVPIKRIVCASNRNKTIADFFRTGHFQITGSSFTTNTPALDLVHIINLERLVFEFVRRDATVTEEIYQVFSQKGDLKLPVDALRRLQKVFVGGFSQDEAVLDTIKNIYHEFDLCVDPHTALAYNVYTRYANRAKDFSVPVYLSPCSPYLYAHTVLEALGLGNKVVKKAKNQDAKNNLVDELRVLAKESDIAPPSSLLPLLEDIFVEKEKWFEQIELKRGQAKVDSFDYVDYDQNYAVNEPIFNLKMRDNFINNLSEKTSTSSASSVVNSNFSFNTSFDFPLCTFKDIDHILAAYLGFLPFETKIVESEYLFKLKEKNRKDLLKDSGKDFASTPITKTRKKEEVKTKDSRNREYDKTKKNLPKQERKNTKKIQNSKKSTSSETTKNKKNDSRFENFRRAVAQSSKKSQSSPLNKS